MMEKEMNVVNGIIVKNDKEYLWLKDVMSTLLEKDLCKSEGKLIETSIALQVIREIMNTPEYKDIQKALLNKMSTMTKTRIELLNKKGTMNETN